MRISAVLLSALVIGAALAGCQGAGVKDRLGARIELTNVRTIDRSEAAVDVPAFFPASIFEKVESATRDNHSVIDGFTIRDGTSSGKIGVQHVTGAYRFQGATRFVDKDIFTETLARAGYTTPANVTEIKHKSTKVGYRAETSRMGNKCVVAITAYQLAGVAFDYPDPYDTSINVEFCGPTVNPTMFDEMLSKVAVVKDRAAFRAALQAK